MFGKKTYTLICHGCGKVHLKESEFISTPLSVGVIAPDGRHWALPAHACQDCMKHNITAIRNAFAYGMSPKAFERAQQEFKEQFEKLPIHEGRF